MGVRRETNEIFAMTYAELHEIATRLGWTNTPSWKRGNYSTRHPGKPVMQEIKRYQMTKDNWSRFFPAPTSVS
jgi:hypothetical protein